MKVLVLGSKGMLGTDLILLCRDNHEVKGVDIQELDITNPHAVREEIFNWKPTVVINAAAYTDVDGSEGNPDRAFKINAEAVGYVAAACRETDARLFHISTDYVFDGCTQIPYVEEDQPHPLGVYGRSKWVGEQRGLKELPEICIVRTAWLYGRAGKNFVKAILKQTEDKQEIRVVSDQKGSPTYTKDLATAFLAMVEQRLHGIYHVTNSGFCTWYEFAKKILEISGKQHIRVKPITSEELNRSARRPAFSVMDCSKFFRVTGKSLRHWSWALEDYLLSEEW
jgi:dTDP-4-dehydrorhamnose reductase